MKPKVFLDHSLNKLKKDYYVPILGGDLEAPEDDDNFENPSSHHVVWCCPSTEPYFSARGSSKHIVSLKNNLFSRVD